MGADFFDATQFPTALFSGDIVPSADGYAADGTLTLKGITQPLRFDFDLMVTDGTAVMTTNFDLLRLDFGVGASMDDESSLGFPVSVAIELTAENSGG